MQVVFDRGKDTLTITLNNAPVRGSDIARTGLIVSFDAAGNVVSVEIPNASRSVAEPTSVSYRMQG